MLIAAGMSLLTTAPAVAEPAPGVVEVRNEAGAVVAQPTGADAIATAIAAVGTSRTDDTKPWSVVVGAGTYGDLIVNEPNVTVRSSDGAIVVISGAGGTDNTGGGCVDITRGNVLLQSLACSNPAGSGIEVRPPGTEGGIVLRRVAVTSPGKDGILVSSGVSAVLEDTTVQGATAPADGIHLQGLGGPGPYRVQGGLVRSNGGDGIDVGAAQQLQVVGVTAEANGENGIEVSGAANFAVDIDGATARGNAGVGVMLGGGGNRLSLTNTTLTGNRGGGVALDRVASPTLSGLMFDGTNAGGDLRFSADIRTGGSYANLTFIDTPVNLADNPRGVIVSAVSATQRARVSRLPAGTIALGRFVRVRNSGAGASRLRMRFVLSPADLVKGKQSGIRVYEDDPPGNRRRWQAVQGSRLVAGGIADVFLNDGRIASGSLTRSAIYAPLAPENPAPQILAVFPANGGTYEGRNGVMSALVADDVPLGAAAFELEVDATRRGGLQLRNGNPVWPRVRLGVGPHVARLRVTDAGGRVSELAWSFTVVNLIPQVKRARSKPFPGSVIRRTRGSVPVSVLMRDDQRIVLSRARVRVDGRRVQVRLQGRRLVARIPLRAGRHRIQVVYTDRDGATVSRGWRFTVRR
jgi:hypothetical protein